MAGDGWRQTVLDAVTAKAASSASRARSHGSAASQRMTRIASSLEAHRLLVRAAALPMRGGITLSGYARRAIMAQVAADLGLSQHEVFEADAAIQVAGVRGGTKDLDGEMFGLWGCQHGDADAEH